MTWRFSFALWLAIVGLVCPEPRLQAQGAPGTLCATTDAGVAANCLRRLYFQQDYAGGQREGAALVATFPDSPLVRAWLAASLAADLQEDSALVIADAMRIRWPNSAWAPFARSLALAQVEGRSAEAIAAGREARTLAPRERDTWWANANALNRGGAYAKAAALVDSALAAAGPSPELLALKGLALLQQGYYAQERDTAAIARAGVALAEAMRLDSSNVEVLTQWARYEGLGSRNEASYRARVRAAALAPRTPDLHAEEWGDFDAKLKLTPAQKRDTAAARVEAFRAANGESPALRLATLQLWRRLREDSLRLSAEERLLRDYPTSVYAERLLMTRINQLRYNIYSRKVADTLQARADLLRMAREFVARPDHVSRQMLGQACTTLFGEVHGDSTLASEELLRVAHCLADNVYGRASLTHVAVALALADRGLELPFAERLAGAAPPLIRPQMEGERRFFDSEGEFVDAVAKQVAGAHDALGWVYFKEGRLADARKEIARALSIRSDHYLALYHSARLAEAGGAGARALDLYARGYVAERREADRPSEAALRRMYRAQHGSDAGYEAYLTDLQAQARARARARTVANRLPKPRPVRAFQLARLGGGTFTPDSLRGKVVVVDFWGVWCGPCVREMPQIQALHERYKADPDVLILTVDTQDPLETLQKFMADKKFTFPVLIDAGYALKAGVMGFPTTWFLGRDGRLVYVQGGSSDDLLEEAGWRIEALKAEGRPVTLR